MFFKDVVYFLLYVLLSDGDNHGPSMSQSTMFCAANAAMCFLHYVLRSESTAAALHSSKGYILRRLVNRCPAAKTRFRAVVSFKPMFCAVRGPREVFQAPSGAGTPCSAQDGRRRTMRNVQDGASPEHDECKE